MNNNNAVTKNLDEKYPNYIYGKTMEFAADEKGDKNAADAANFVAYLENAGDGNTVLKSTGINLYSDNITADDIAKLAEYNKNSASSETVVKNSNAGKRYVDTDGVRIRNGYGLKATAMGMLNKGDEVEYTGRKTSEKIDGHYWAEIVHDDKKYLIAADYLRIDKPIMQAQEEMFNDDVSTAETKGKSFYEDYKSKINSKNSYVTWAKKPFTIPTSNGEKLTPSPIIKIELEKFCDEYFLGKSTAEFALDEEFLKAMHEYMINGIKSTKRPNNIGAGLWKKQIENDLKWVDEVFGQSSKFAKVFKSVPYISIGVDAAKGVSDNVKNKSGIQETVTDFALEIGFGAAGAAASSGIASVITTALSGTALGTAVPGIGNVIGACAGLLVGLGIYCITESTEIYGKSLKERADDAIDYMINGIKEWFS